MQDNWFPTTPRYKYAKYAAIDVLVSCDYLTVPISPGGCINQYLNGNVKYAKYSDISKTTGKSIDQISSDLQSMDAYGFYSRNKTLCICYNDTYSINRINFSLAHELGHFVLNHYELNCDLTKLTEKQYKLLEDEANAFAAELLIPHPLLQQLEINCLTSDFISKKFAVSKEVASIILKTMYYPENIELYNYKKYELFNKFLTLLQYSTENRHLYNKIKKCISK